MIDDDQLEDVYSHQASSAFGSSELRVQNFVQSSSADSDQNDQEHSSCSSKTSLKSLESQLTIQGLSKLMNIPVDFIAEGIVDMPSPNMTRVVTKSTQVDKSPSTQSTTEHMLRQASTSA